ncbi:MAG: Ig-like domain-containing protein [Thermoplasmata archaeon]|nr:MAG: Ig-like domain-containing protein [Thermoplasmata archaeon]
MRGRKVRRVFRLCLGILLILSLVQVMHFNGPLVENASAGSSWVQTTEADFNGGTLTDVEVTPSGEVKLPLLTKNVEDNFYDESKISYKNHIKVDTIVGESKLVKINNTFGGFLHEAGVSIEQTSDGGYIITGGINTHGGLSTDVWLIKTDSYGDEQWNKIIGGLDDEGGSSVQQTSDGGYIIAGYTTSYGAGLYDVLLIKTDSSGNEEWNRTYGGSSSELGESVQQTSDGGYIITGETSSYGAGGEDVWLIKTDSFGNKQWDKTFGGSEDEGGECCEQTPDGGFIITGYVSSWGGGSSDAWLIKTDGSGSEDWNITFGGSDSDEGKSVNQTTDGGYIITGYSTSYGPGTYDVWLIKTDGSGSEDWNNTFGGSAWDFGSSVKQTSDDGYIIVGETWSYGSGPNNLWLIKTNYLGNEEWTKIFGGKSSDYGFSARQTSDGGYIITGCTYSYGSGDGDVWLIKTNQTGYLDFTYGVMTSVDLLAGQVVYSINTFDCNTSVFPETGIKVQFSQNSTYWYNSGGTLDGWDTLSDGFNSIDLSSLGWQGPGFYYQMNFTSNNEKAPSVQNISFLYNQFTSGDLVSQPYNAGADVNWYTISWTKINDTIKFQLRTADTQSGLSSKDFVGPEGTSSTYYTSSGTNIWSGHTSDKWWIQYKVYLSSSLGNTTPILQDVTISYNNIPTQPQISSPVNNIILNDSTPLFSWSSDDLDGSLNGFQVIIDEDSRFNNVEYDSGEQSTSNQYWQFPEGTSYNAIADGSWYWKVRTRDNDGVWGPYSESNNFTVDTTPPTGFLITPKYHLWTSNNQFNITFSTTDATSSVDHYEVKIDTGSFSQQTSPYKIPPQIDGIHNITVRAFDIVGNYIDCYVDIYIDTNTPTITHTPVTSGTDGVSINITAVVVDDGSGIDNIMLYYKKPIETSYASEIMNVNGNTYYLEINPAVVTSDGLEYYIKAIDKASPANIAYFGTGGQVTDEPDSNTDIDITITGFLKIETKSPTGSEVPVDQPIVIVFSEAMDEVPTKAAFSITPNVDGAFDLKGATLTFTPTEPLALGEKYNITISKSAISLSGNTLKEDYQWEFITTREAEGEEKESFWETWEPIITGATVLASIIVFLVGFLTVRKKRSKLRQYIERIDDTFNKYKKDHRECEQELIALREDIKAEVKEGKIEENHFLILDKRIDDYLMELKTMEKEEAREELEEDITEPMSGEEDVGEEAE